MHTYVKPLSFFLFFSIFSNDTLAQITEPDYVLYGQVTVDGKLLTKNDFYILKAKLGDKIIASFYSGTNKKSDHYILRIPIKNRSDLNLSERDFAVIGDQIDIELDYDTHESKTLTISTIDDRGRIKKKDLIAHFELRAPSRHASINTITSVKTRKGLGTSSESAVKKQATEDSKTTNRQTVKDKRAGVMTSAPARQLRSDSDNIVKQDVQFSFPLQHSNLGGGHHTLSITADITQIKPLDFVEIDGQFATQDKINPQRWTVNIEVLDQDERTIELVVAYQDGSSQRRQLAIINTEPTKSSSLTVSSATYYKKQLVYTFNHDKGIYKQSLSGNKSRNETIRLSSMLCPESPRILTINPYNGTLYLKGKENTHFYSLNIDGGTCKKNYAFYKRQENLLYLMASDTIYTHNSSQTLFALRLQGYLKNRLIALNLQSNQFMPIMESTGSLSNTILEKNNAHYLYQGNDGFKLFSPASNTWHADIPLALGKYFQKHEVKKGLILAIVYPLNNDDFLVNDLTLRQYLVLNENQVSIKTLFNHSSFKRVRILGIEQNKQLLFALADQRIITLDLSSGNYVFLTKESY